jgi:hypothetical protein
MTFDKLAARGFVGRHKSRRTDAHVRTQLGIGIAQIVRDFLRDSAALLGTSGILLHE